MKQALHIITTLLIAILVLSCDKTDDVAEIFNGQRFKITGLTYNGIKSVKEVKEFYESDNIYWVTFSSHTFHGTLQAGTNIEGAWTAEGKNRRMTISFNGDTTTDGMSELCRLVYLTLRGATYYSGDKNVMRIYKDNDSYVDMSSL